VVNEWIVFVDRVLQEFGEIIDSRRRYLSVPVVCDSVGSILGWVGFAGVYQILAILPIFIDYGGPAL